jgi:3-hydroxybutyryl-CoA dehydratase
MALQLHSAEDIDGERRMNAKTIDEITVGDQAEMALAVSADLVTGFVTLSGDRNPIHRDAGFAATTPFREPIAPGMLTAALIAAVIGSELPGPGCVYLSQSLKFLRPVKLGDTITARVEVVETVRDRNRVRLRTECDNAAGDIVLVGEAWVMPPVAAVERSRGGEAALPLARAA